MDILTGERETNLIHTHRGLIEIGPKKWLMQVAFILLRQTINLRGIDRTKKLRFECLISY